jgi:c-di-GMP-related signal transduction protein
MHDTTSAELSSDTPEQEDSTAIARQAILDKDRAVFGYELFDRSRTATGFTSASDAELLFNVLSHADNAALIDKKIMFINCTHDSLSGAHLELIQPERVVLEVPPLTNPTAEDIEQRRTVLEDITRRGFRLAFNHTVLAKPHSAWMPYAAFIKFDLMRLKPEQVEPVIQFAQKHSTAQLIVEKIETQAQYEQVNSLGIKLFQGYWFSKPTIIKGQTIRPAQATIIQLINLVRQQASTAEIEEVLKRDATLSFNLLRFINSSGFGLSCEITSFRHAVMILGLKKLFRWAALLMITSKAGGTPPAVGSTAIVRGRLMELLAAELLSPEECDNAFVVGVFSLLDTMLGVPLEKALEAISLPDMVTDALLRNTGALAPFLDLTKACESADDDAFAKAATALQLTNRQVNWAHLQALAWAETLGDDMGG